MKRRLTVMVACLVSTALCPRLAGAQDSPLDAESFIVHLKVYTSNLANAGTDDPAYFTVHYLKPDETSNANGKKPAKKKFVIAQHKVRLDNVGDDFRAGGVDSYSIHCPFPLTDIRAVEIGIWSGSDAWHLAGIEYVIEANGRKSLAVSHPIGKWTSGDRYDLSSKGTTPQFYVFKANPPRFPKAK